MSHNYRNDIPKKNAMDRAPTSHVELSNGDLVALSVVLGSIEGDVLPCFIYAWLVDAEGDPQQDANSRLITVSAAHSVTSEQAIALGAPRVIAALHDMVLGVDNDDVPVRESHRASCSIQGRIALARFMGEVKDLTEV